MASNRVWLNWDAHFPTTIRNDEMDVRVSMSIVPPCISPARAPNPCTGRATRSASRLMLQNRLLTDCASTPSTPDPTIKIMKIWKTVRSEVNARVRSP